MKNLLLALFITLISFSVEAENLSAEDKEKAIKQLHFLMSNSADRAEKRLKEKGIFVPYGAVIKKDGKVKKISLGEGKKFNAEAMVTVLHSAMKTLAATGKIAASAIFYTAKIDDQSKVLIVELEHSRGIALINAIPYQINNGKVIFGKAVESEKDLNIMNFSDTPNENP